MTRGKKQQLSHNRKLLGWRLLNWRALAQHEGRKALGLIQPPCLLLLTSPTQRSWLLRWWWLIRLPPCFFTGGSLPWPWSFRLEVAWVEHCWTHSSVLQRRCDTQLCGHDENSSSGQLPKIKAKLPACQMKTCVPVPRWLLWCRKIKLCSILWIK